MVIRPTRLFLAELEGGGEFGDGGGFADAGGADEADGAALGPLPLPAGRTGRC